MGSAEDRADVLVVGGSCRLDWRRWEKVVCAMNLGQRRDACFNVFCRISGAEKVQAGTIITTPMSRSQC